jgi:hypothetical protein
LFLILLLGAAAFLNFERRTAQNAKRRWRIPAKASSFSTTNCIMSEQDQHESEVPEPPTKRLKKLNDFVDAHLQEEGEDNEKLESSIFFLKPRTY